MGIATACSWFATAIRAQEQPTTAWSICRDCLASFSLQTFLIGRTCSECIDCKSNPH